MHLPDALYKELVAQYGRELTAERTYLTLSSVLEDLGLTGMSKYAKDHAAEEHGHALRFYEYVVKRGLRVPAPALPEVPAGQTTAEACFQAIHDHELMISQHIVDLHKMACDKDPMTEEFLNWFLAEQVEEENNSLTNLVRVQMAGDNPAALLVLDHDFGD
jgi:ferritin